ncbi:MAG: hypothetical protein KOO60_07780 [Gemmatimonadales bacterium]|nr:hypothetical protein [Gemmatimonadales bacterium]
MIGEGRNKRIKETREKARTIYRNIFPPELGRNLRPLGPEHSPFPIRKEPPEDAEYSREEKEVFDEIFPESPVDNDCLQDLSKASGDYQIVILNECPSLYPSHPGQLDKIADAVGRPPIESEILAEEFPWKFDRCAWYRPIHYHGDAFGIFIRRSCVMRQAKGIARRVDPDKLNMSNMDAALYCQLGAAVCLLLHEFYHHKAESFGIRLSVAGIHQRNMVPYAYYHQNVYRQLMKTGSDDLIEESLANAYAYRQLIQIPYKTILPPEILLATRANLKASFRMQPPGYRRAGHFLSSRAFREGEYILQQQMLEGTPHTRGHHNRWESAPDMLRSVFLVREVPVYMVP